MINTILTYLFFYSLIGLFFWHLVMLVEAYNDRKDFGPEVAVLWPLAILVILCGLSTEHFTNYQKWLVSKIRKKINKNDD